jgi:hypothetical protein
MNDVLSITEQYKIGQPIFFKLFELNDKDLKEKLKSICADKLDKYYIDIFESGDVTRTIKSEVPSEISIYFYSGIKITPFGINFHPEHGPVVKLVEFNKYFTLGDD